MVCTVICKLLYGILTTPRADSITRSACLTLADSILFFYINPSGGTLPSNEGQLPNWSLRLSVEDSR